MNLIRSIRHQTLLILISLTLCVSLAFSSLAVVTAYIVEDMTLSNLLDELTKDYERYYAENLSLPKSTPSFINIYPNMKDLPEWAKQRAYRKQISGEIFTPESSTHYHYHKLNLQGETGYLLAQVSDLLAVTRQPIIIESLLCGIFIAIVITILISIKLSQKIVNPIIILANAVKLNENPNNTIRLPNLPFELGYLSRSMQSTFDQLKVLLENEKAFSGNVSHELRTPLTVMKNTCALISQRGFSDRDMLEIKSACNQMEQTVDILLALARKDALDKQICRAAIAVEQALLRCHDSSLKNFDILITIPDDYKLPANPKLLEIILINLLRNAAEHASTPVLSIFEENGWLIFENNNKNPPIDDLIGAGMKGHSSSGIGQGLYLVAKIVEHFGWQFHVECNDQKFRIKMKP